MKIVVLEGSPNRHASSNLLAEEFIRGAKEAGHTAEIIDAPMPTCIPVPAASVADTKVHAYKRTIWKSSAGRSWTRI